MATPITWQNIQAPDLSAAGRPLEGAQRSFSSMFDAFGGVLAQHQKVGEQNWQNTRSNNTNAFLDRMAAYATPEQLAAAQQSGELARLRQSFGAQIDSTAIRGAEEQRLNQLRAGAKQAGEFEDFTVDRQQRGTKDQIASLIAAGKFTEAQKLLDDNDLRNEAALATNLTGAQRMRTEWGYADKGELRAGEKHVADIANAKRQLELEAQRNAISSASVAVQREGLGIQREEAKARQEAALSKQLTEAIQARGKMKDSGINTPEAMEQITKYINDNYKDEATRADLLAKANKAMQITYTDKGEVIPVTPAAVMQAIGTTQDSRIMKWFTGIFNDSDQGDDIKPNLKNIIKGAGYKESIKNREKQAGYMTTQIQRLEDQLNYGSPGNLPKKK